MLFSALAALPFIVLLSGQTVGDRVARQEMEARVAIRCIAIASSHKLPDTSETESIRFGMFDGFERYARHLGSVPDLAEEARATLDRRMTLEQVLDERERCAQLIGATTRPVAEPGALWARPPRPEYPERAQSRGIERGEVTVRCEAVDQVPTNCVIVSETPTGAGFGQVTLAEMRRARFLPHISGPQDYTIRFSLQ